MAGTTISQWKYNHLNFAKKINYDMQNLSLSNIYADTVPKVEKKTLKKQSTASKCSSSLNTKKDDSILTKWKGKTTYTPNPYYGDLETCNAADIMNPILNYYDKTWPTHNQNYKDWISELLRSEGTRRTVGWLTKIYHRATKTKKPVAHEITMILISLFGFFPDQESHTEIHTSYSNYATTYGYKGDKYYES